MTDFCFDINCSCSTNTIGILLSIAFVGVSFGLLISGAVCTKSGTWIANPRDCENVYVSGILMCFIIGVVLFFWFLAYLAERCDSVALAEARARAVAPVVVVNPHKKKKKMPLHSEAV